MSPERDDFQDDDERDEFASPSIFSAGWFRAVLVLTVLAIAVVISLPYLLNWFDASPPARASKSAEPLKPAPSATPPPTVAPTPAPAPAAPLAAAPEARPPAPVAPQPTPKAAVTPPASPAQAPKAVAAAPSPSSESARKAQPEKAPAKAAAEKPTTKAAAEKAPPKAAAEKPVEKASPKAAERTPAKVAERVPAKPADNAPPPTRVVAKVDAPSRPAAIADTKPAAVAASGSYWIQLGAFKDQQKADSLAKSLRDAGFPVQVAPLTKASAGETKGATQQHELFVTETSVEKVNAALKGRGTARAVSGGVAVKPAFSLQDAMTVSKRLTDEGLRVVIRPAGGLAVASAGPAPGTLHAVRAGGYPSRASALAARDELAAKGHQGFLSEGPAK